MPDHSVPSSLSALDKSTSAMRSCRRRRPGTARADDRCGAGSGGGRRFEPVARRGGFRARDPRHVAVPQSGQSGGRSHRQPQRRDRHLHMGRQLRPIRLEHVGVGNSAWRKELGGAGRRRVRTHASEGAAGGIELGWREAPGTPDRHFGQELKMRHRTEAERGIAQPIHMYPIFESAIATPGARPPARTWHGFPNCGGIRQRGGGQSASVDAGGQDRAGDPHAERRQPPPSRTPIPS